MKGITIHLNTCGIVMRAVLKHRKIEKGTRVGVGQERTYICL